MAKISEETKQYYIEMTKLIISSYIDLLRDYLKKGKLKKADEVVDKIYERFLDILDWQNLKFKNEYNEFEEEINDFEEEDEENENDWTKNCTNNEENQDVEKDVEEIKPKVKKTTYHSVHRDDDDDE